MVFSFKSRKCTQEVVCLNVYQLPLLPVYREPHIIKKSDKWCCCTVVIADLSVTLVLSCNRSRTFDDISYYHLLIEVADTSLTKTFETVLQPKNLKKCKKVTTFVLHFKAVSCSLCNHITSREKQEITETNTFRD